MVGLVVVVAGLVVVVVEEGWLRGAVVVVEAGVVPAGATPEGAGGGTRLTGASGWATM